MPWDAIATLAGMLLAVAGVLAFAYFATRYIARRGMGGRVFTAGNRGNIRLLERAPLGRDQSLVVVQVGGAYLLLGVTPTDITLLRELSEEEAALWEMKTPAASDGNQPPMRFQDALAEVLKKKKM